MSYEQLPKFDLDITRGVTKRVHFGTLTKNGETVNLVESDVKVYIKSAVDASREPVVKLTPSNGLDLSNNELTVKFEEWTIGLQAAKYYYDIYCKIDGDSKIIVRGGINFSGAISVEGNGCECE